MVTQCGGKNFHIELHLKPLVRMYLYTNFGILMLKESRVTTRVDHGHWVMGHGSWVMGHGSLGSHKSMGQMGHGSRPLDPVTHGPCPN